MAATFRDHVVVITGAAQGLGASHARGFAAAGAEVVMADVVDTVEASAAGLRAEGYAATASLVDVADPGGWASLMAQVQASFGRLDVLVNNAGIAQVGDFLDESLEQWQRMLAVNATGTYLGIKAVAPVMIEQGRGAIVNTASVAGVVGTPEHFGYSATKGAIVAMTKSAAISLAPHRVRVNVVCPGSVQTPLARAGGSTWILERTPLGRRANPEEVSAAVLFLASEDASFITGTEVAVDGGFLAG